MVQKSLSGFLNYLPTKHEFTFRKTISFTIAFHRLLSLNFFVYVYILLLILMLLYQILSVGFFARSAFTRLLPDDQNFFLVVTNRFSIKKYSKNPWHDFSTNWYFSRKWAKKSKKMPKTRKSAPPKMH